MFGEVYGAVSQVPGLRVFPRLDPPLPTPGQYDVEMVDAERCIHRRVLATAGAVVGAGWQSGKFLYVDTDLKIDLPRGAAWCSTASVSPTWDSISRASGASSERLLGGAYVNRFNYLRAQLQGHSADR